MGLPLLLGAVPSTVSRGRASSGNRDTEGACKGDKFEPRPKGEFLGGLQKCPSPAPWAPRSPVPGRDAESSKAEQRLRRSSRPTSCQCGSISLLPASQQPSFSLGHSPFWEARLCWEWGLGPSAPPKPEALPLGRQCCPHSVPSTPGQGAVSSVVEAPLLQGSQQLWTQTEPSWVQIPARPLAGCVP